ncbi:hypothetical protein SLEP1_g28828 [Rubroshorea leprosula]|uniref:DUF7731 domain-containing protein n=1 Tax=Rubroshorea leprosula TaxID=152421 RepID=A0AAV5K6X7_9ROSI|nr:hypothetical protein SLEP1_g28828 [Rubroshorea leprosula]
MAASSSLCKPSSFNLISILIFTCFMYSGYGQNLPTTTLAKVLSCFNNKLIYSACNEEYRLNESGELQVPVEATELFCSGPCLGETESVLNCVDNTFSNFIFYNRATVQAVRNVLNSGCSFSTQRGNFNVGEYLQGLGDISSADRLSNLICFTAFALIIGCYILIF